MFKNLIYTSILATNFISAPVVSNLQILATKNTNFISTNNVTETVIIDNMDNYTQDEQTGSQDLHLPGIDSQRTHRIYIDSTGDNKLPGIPEEPNPDDYIRKANKNDWYNHLIHGLQINIKDYASSKDEFLEKYKAITFSYFFMVNFWNSSKKWTFEYGKEGPFQVGVDTFPLSPNNVDYNLFEKTDSSHSSNERAKLVIKQIWEGDLLKYDVWLSVWYNWKKGSVIHHASLGQFKKEYYTFSATPPRDDGKTANIEKLQTFSSFTVTNFFKDLSTTEIDNLIKTKAAEELVKNSWFKTATVMTQGYYGSRKINGTNYIYALLIRWSPTNGLASRDSTLILNGLDLNRIMKTRYFKNKFEFDYENSLDLKQNLSFDGFDSNILDIEMKGDFHLPIIYFE